MSKLIIAQAGQGKLKLTVWKVLLIKALIVTEWCPDGSQQARSICGFDSLTTCISFPSSGLCLCCLYQIETERLVLAQAPLFTKTIFFLDWGCQTWNIMQFWESFLKLHGAVAQRMLPSGTRGSVLCFQTNIHRHPSLEQSKQYLHYHPSNPPRALFTNIWAVHWHSFYP